MVNYFIIYILLLTVFRCYLQYRQYIHVKNTEAIMSSLDTIAALSINMKSVPYNLAKIKMNIFNMIIKSLVLLFLTVGGVIQYLDNWYSMYLHNNIVLSIALIFTIISINTLVDRVFSYYNTFFIEQNFGFNKTSLKLFIIDCIKLLLISIVLLTPLCILVLLFMQYFLYSWWWLTGILIGLFNLFVLIIYPIFIAPLFNQFIPLDDAALLKDIKGLLNRCGFCSSGVYVIDGSKRSSHSNAYFTGFGKNKRIVFFDNLLKLLNVNEIIAVLAHELGHFHKNHVLKQMIVNISVNFIVLYLVYVLLQIPLFYHTLGISHIVFYNGLLLILISLEYFLFPFLPLIKYFNRKHEFEADYFAVNILGDSDSLISSLIKLHFNSAMVAVPDKLYSMFYYTHPPILRRIQQIKTVKYNT